MAVPKRKTAKARQRKGRSHMALSLPAIDRCPQCHSLKLAHHVCPICGSYAGRDVVEVKTKRRE